MVRILWLLFFFMTLSYSLKAQTDSAKSQTPNTVQVLDEVITSAYEYDRPLKDVPAAIGIVNQKDFERYNNTSVLSALNTIAGVHMEERSPGSYRLSVRGSSLRSPFGIRNVKVYWNDLPFTDPGGNTYLNLFDFSSFQKAEIIKGPAGSLYGAGTGGVLLLSAPGKLMDQDRIEVATTAGSYGLKRINAGWLTSSKSSTVEVKYAHQQSNGYREQSSMNRDGIMLEGNFSVNAKSVIAINALYADLFYETPGGLTKTEYDANPKQARPTVGQSKGAVDQQAAITNKTFYSSISQEYQFNSKWSNHTGFYGTFTQFNNPTTRNYERRTEQSYGARSVTRFATSGIKLDFGGEFQHGFSPIKVYANNLGQTGALQTDNEIISTAATLFSQVDFTLPAKVFLTAGASYNFYTIDFAQYSLPVAHESRNFTPVLSPRVALLKEITSFISAYASFSQGFSPPTVAELYPSTSIFDKNLKPEKGNNYEIGFKGNLAHNTIRFEVAGYLFKLKQAISSRRDTTSQGDPEYFVNAGNTNQKGIEVNMNWQPHRLPSNFFSDLRLWISYTYNHYRFANYLKDTVSLSGNKLTGTAPNILVIGFDLTTKKGFYMNATLSYTDPIPLDDANKAFAKSYTLLSCRVGYRFNITHALPMEFFGGGENLLNVKYSLGNDLNASGGKYIDGPTGKIYDSSNVRSYNAAMPVNFYIGVKSQLVLAHRH